jgi:hypothetical protein
MALYGAHPETSTAFESSLSITLSTHKSTHSSPSVIMYTSLKTLAGLFSVAAVCAALPTDEQPKRCGLTPTQGPTILVAVAT